MYEVKWINIIRDNLSPRLYVPTIMAWLSVMMQSVQNTHRLFVNYTNDIDYKLNHNGQVCYLEAALNDSFDFVERRIYISDAGGAVVKLLHRDSDQDPLLLQDDANKAFILHNDSAYEGGSFDFIVNIPYRLSDADMFRLKALVNYYKLAGKRYDVVVK